MSVVVAHPALAMFDRMVAVAAGRADDLDRGWVWGALLRARALHGDLGCARRAIERSTTRRGDAAGGAA